MGITQPAEVDIETRPECSQNWEQVFVECDTTGFWQERGISKDGDGQKGADGGRD
ncbi:Crotonobetainyl-CoA reductase [Clarias magur]|uniref:Crotonobetainyl-CoA reductase n=1 Tax=Clarias magur TaxID=1594786 RepID=A0A8J4WW82_CLAMG|nr:Crotonobetainyl-CoA reductase [Clarias magur]